MGTPEASVESRVAPPPRPTSALRDLGNVRPLYILPMDPLTDEVLIPGFKGSTKVDCMVGYFSSSVLASLAPGLATYISHTDGTFRLIISPVLRPEDQDALESGTRTPEALAQEAFEDFCVTEDALQQHTLKCLSHLLRIGRIEIRIALMKDALFHPKVWLFQAGSDVIAAHGSSNVTFSGIKKNVEQIAASKSWEDPNQRYICEKLSFNFNEFWSNRNDSCTVIGLPQAVKDRLLKTYNTSPPTEEELAALYRKANGIDQCEVDEDGSLDVHPPRFSIPAGLQYQDGPFAHQGRAVNAWCNNGHRGVLEMATGSGKTITAMICAHRLYGERKPLLVVIAAPYVPLIQQWCDELKPFGICVTNLTHSSGTRGRATEINRIKRNLRRGATDAEAIVVSHRTLCSPAFQSEIEKIDCAKLLIADEAHNLGSEGFISNPPDFFDFRLGLSATPVRQYDDEGTNALFAYFGNVVFKFELSEAIGLCLVPYDYFVHPVELTPAEMDVWYDLTSKIKSNAWRSDGGKPDEYLAKLFRDRRALLENAENKIAHLRAELASLNPRTLRHTLIYASDKNPQQLDNVNNELRSFGILFHQLTYQETADREETARIINSFQRGELQVLTAKRVLDEGVNIPQICRAYILASTTVERQWTQRRGRLLRTCNELGKTHAEIHDFVAIPPSMTLLDDEGRTLVRSELFRVQEFARLARNAGRQDGPLETIHKLIEAAFL
jgi:superfamily II DNA or RNA helicase